MYKIEYSDTLTDLRFTVLTLLKGILHLPIKNQLGAMEIVRKIRHTSFFIHRHNQPLCGRELTVTSCRQITLEGFSCTGLEEIKKLLVFKGRATRYYKPETLQN
jgi:hypothetical protein